MKAKPFKLLILFSLLMPIIQLQGQDEKKPFEVKISGMVKSDFFWDSRQTVAAREGHFLLYPSPVRNDADGKDINGKSNFNILSIQSTIGFDLKGPDVFGAKTSGKIEGDFFAQLNDNINLLRMRHAWLKLNWEKTELLMGQFWIPFFIPGCFPNTVSFNTGAPIQPFGRSPQIRFSQKIGDLKVLAILSSQRDYPNTGPNGVSSEYMRNSGIPAIDAQLHYEKNNTEAGTAFLAGAGAGYKKIVPRLRTIQGYSTNNAVESLSAIAFTKIQLKPVTLKLQAVYGQNFDDALMIGGYTIKEILEADRGFVSYMPSSTLSYWTDIHTNGKKWQFGAYAGLSQNKGFKSNILGPELITGRAMDIESLYRVSPRIVFNMEHIRFALEAEYTVANYGTSYNEKGIPVNTVKADNLRILLGAYYFIK
jgi:hypothetical protein